MGGGLELDIGHDCRPGPDWLWKFIALRRKTMSRTIEIAEFKARFSRILDEVGRTGESVTVTKQGRPIAEMRPIIRIPPGGAS